MLLEFKVHPPINGRTTWTAPHKWGPGAYFLSPIYGALLCSTGIHARVGEEFLGFDVWIGVKDSDIVPALPPEDRARIKRN